MSIAVALAVRYLLVVLFFPFSALDKIINFKGALGQAAELVRSPPLATGLIVMGLGVEILMPLGILTGTADRLAAFVMAGYCMVTALLWKRWWQPGDFWRAGDSKGAISSGTFSRISRSPEGFCCWRLGFTQEMSTHLCVIPWVRRTLTVTPRSDEAGAPKR